MVRKTEEGRRLFTPPSDGWLGVKALLALEFAEQDGQLDAETAGDLVETTHGGATLRALDLTEETDR